MGTDVPAVLTPVPGLAVADLGAGLPAAGFVVCPIAAAAAKMVTINKLVLFIPLFLRAQM
jgi:hypothetical protein